MEEAHKLPGCKILDLYELKSNKSEHQMLIDIEKEIHDL